MCIRLTCKFFSSSFPCRKIDAINVYRIYYVCRRTNTDGYSNTKKLDIEQGSERYGRRISS